MEELQVVEISFQMLDSRGIVGYADMDPSTGVGVLRHLEAGEAFEVRLESGGQALYLGDFGIFLESASDAALVTAKWV